MFFRRAPLRVAAGLLLLSACSVKEDRLDCPCLLTLDLTDLQVLPVQVLVDGEEFRDIREVRSDTALTLAVPRPSVRIRAVSGTDVESEGILVPYGFDCPPLYLFDTLADTSGETASVPVRLRKAYCALTIRFSGPPGWEDPYAIEVTGGVNGYLPGGGLSEGPFCCRLSGEGTLRLPRQRDASLRMDVVLQDNKVRTFALGAYIEASGYDWAAPDLEDLTLEVDVSLTRVTFRIDRWSETVPLEIVV